MDSYSPGTLVPPKIVKIKCPRFCGWFRDYTRSNAWMEDFIDHPLYGPIKGGDLVRLEVQTHDCIETRNARIRHSRKAMENARV